MEWINDATMNNNRCETACPWYVAPCNSKGSCPSKCGNCTSYCGFRTSPCSSLAQCGTYIYGCVDAYI